MLVSLVNTGEPLYIVNRSRNRPSHEKEYLWLNRSIDLCKKSGFQKIVLRGDTDFSQTKHLDQWNNEDVHFIFGMDSMKNLVKKAENIPEDAWKSLKTLGSH